MYVHQYHKLRKSRHVADKQETAFIYSACRFDELITRDDQGIIKGINTGPGIRASFVGPHITGREAVGTLVNAEVRAGMKLMESGLHKHYVNYTSHFNPHHADYHEASNVPEFWSFDDAPHIHSVTGRGSGGVEELGEHKKKSVVRFNTSPLPRPPTHPVGRHHPQPGSTLGTTTNDHSPHYLQTTVAAEGHAAGHPHVEPHHLHHASQLHTVHKHKVHHKADKNSDHPPLPPAGHEPDLIVIGKSEHHHVQKKGLPHYLQTTNVMEMHTAGRVHHDPHMTSHEDRTSASAHANAGGSHAHRHASHDGHAHHHEESGVPHYMQETDTTEAHHAGHSGYAGHAVARHKQGKVGKKTHKADLKSASSVQLKRAQEGKVGVERAKNKPKRIATKYDYPLKKSTTKTSSKTMGPVASPSRSLVPSRHPHSETMAEKAARKSLESKMVQILPPHKTSRYEQAHEHQHRVHGSLDPAPKHEAYKTKEADSESDDNNNPDLLRFVTRADLYRNAGETSTDESDASAAAPQDSAQHGHQGSRIAGEMMDTSSLYRTVLSLDKESVRDNMERTATTHIFKRMNDAKDTPLMKFFRGAVKLDQAKRPRRSANAEAEKSTYLDEEDEVAKNNAKRISRERDQAALRDMSQYIADSGPTGAAHDATAVGAALLERSMNLSYATNADTSMRLERSFVSLQDDDSLGRVYDGAAAGERVDRGLNTSGISLIEDDEEDDEGIEGDVLGHNDHTLALFRDPSSRQRRKLEMFEVVNTLDDALRLVQETRWAMAKLRRHAFLTKIHRQIYHKNSSLRLQNCLRGWNHLHKSSIKQFSLCDAIFARKAKAMALARLHYFGYTRMQRLLSKLTKTTESNIKRRATDIWWVKTRTLLSGHRVTRLRRQGALRKRFAAWVWCTSYVPGMTAIRKKVTRRVCMPLLSRWRAKTVRLGKVRKVFTTCLSAWEDRLVRTVHRSDYLRSMDVWDCWRLYVTLVKIERMERKKIEMAYFFRGAALTSKCLYAWIDFHVRAGAVKRAAKRKEVMTLRVCIDAIRDEASYTRLAINYASQHHVSLVRRYSFLAWKRLVQHSLYHSPRGYHRLTHYRLFFDEIRTMPRERIWQESLLPQQQRRQTKRILAGWTSLVIRRMRYRIGLNKLDHSYIGYKARCVIDNWPGRDSFAKGEALRRQTEERGRAKIVLVDVDETEKRKKEKERKKREEEEANKQRSFIQYRKLRPVQHRAQLLGIIYSMEDSHSVMKLFILLRTVLIAWSDAAHTDRMLRGRHRLVMFRHKRFLLEHSLRVWMNRCSATSHRLALWIANKYSQHAHKTLAAPDEGSSGGSGGATRHLIDTYSRMPANDGETDPIHDDDDVWTDGGWGNAFRR